MITTKRQMRRESDRFGGYYGGESNGAPLVSDYAPIADFEPITQSAQEVRDSVFVADDIGMSAAPMITNIPAAPAQPQPQIRYTQPPKQQRAEKPQQAFRPHKSEDILPTVKTRAYATVKPAEDSPVAEEQQAPRVRNAIPAKMKVLLCVYIIVAVMLAIAVITTGVVISQTAAQVDSLVATVNERQTTLAQKERELAILTDDNAIRGKATELGMVKAAAPLYSVGAVENVEYPAAEPRTDAADAFFDAMSKILN